MANEKISELPSGLPAQPGDAVPIARAGSNYSLAASAIAALAPPTIIAQVSGNTAGVTAIISSGTLVLAGGSNVTLSQNGNSISFNATGGIAASLAGNTAGALAVVSTGTLVLAGGNNVTLSQNGNSVTISANTAVAANLSVSAGTTTGAFGGLTFANANDVSFGLNNGTITATVTYPTTAAYYFGGNTTGSIIEQYRTRSIPVDLGRWNHFWRLDQRLIGVFRDSVCADSGLGQHWCDWICDYHDQRVSDRRNK